MEVLLKNHHGKSSNDREFQKILIKLLDDTQWHAIDITSSKYELINLQQKKS